MSVPHSKQSVLPSVTFRAVGLEFRMISSSPTQPDIKVARMKHHKHDKVTKTNKWNTTSTIR
jgi:hypothetical protein